MELAPDSPSSPPPPPPPTPLLVLFTEQQPSALNTASAYSDELHVSLYHLPSPATGMHAEE